MGRMADIWRNADRGPMTPLPIPGALATIDALPTAAPAIDMNDDDDVPFIEVGGPRAVMKHLDSISPKSSVSPRPQGSENIAPPAKRSNRVEPVAVMNVRFEAVHVGRVNGRAIGPEFIAFHQPNHAVSVQYRSLLAEIATQLPGTKPRVLLVISAAPGAGGSTVVLNLGITLAKQDGIRATVVDAHFAKPELASKLGIAGTPGLRDVLARQTPLAWSLQETPQPNLFALTAGRTDAPPAAALAPIIEQLRARSEWVIVDAGPWASSLVPLAEACDAVYLVHADNDTTAGERINAILGATGRLRGCIVTKR